MRSQVTISKVAIKYRFRFCQYGTTLVYSAMVAGHLFLVSKDYHFPIGVTPDDNGRRDLFDHLDPDAPQGLRGLRLSCTSYALLSAGHYPASSITFLAVKRIPIELYSAANFSNAGLSFLLSASFHLSFMDPIFSMRDVVSTLLRLIRAVTVSLVM
jgi:hypothetical protein